MSDASASGQPYGNWTCPHDPLGTDPDTATYCPVAEQSVDDDEPVLDCAGGPGHRHTSYCYGIDDPGGPYL